MTAEEKLYALGLTLPEPPKPAGAYTRAVWAGRLIFVSGQLPVEKGEVKFTGKLGSDLSVEQGYEAARLCGLNAMSILKAEVGSLAQIQRIVRLCGYVCSADGFSEQPQVINGASEFFNQVFGERGVHSRLAIGVNALPLGAAVELEVIAQVSEERTWQ